MKTPTVSRYCLLSILCLLVPLTSGFGASPTTDIAVKPPVAGHALDEPMSGHTLRGTPVTKRTPECFPAERRNVFWQMDAVASGPGGALEPLNFDVNGDGKISDAERQAIQGRNTWLLWGGGNETFWGWLQEDGFGLVDMMILLDSRQRGHRFDTAGLINQPGFVSNSDPSKKLLGLYFDQPATSEKPLPAWLAAYDPKSVGPSEGGRTPGPNWFTQPDDDRDENGELAKRVYPPPHHPQALFPTKGGTVPVWNEDGTPQLDAQGKEKLMDLDAFVKQIQDRLPKDGLDYTVYGYPSGVFGMRLLLNPDFFANTPEADRARRYWNQRVMQTKDRYYVDPSLNADPTLVRPFRTAVSCGFCHVGPHPLSPPVNPNEPEWYNLSSIIGAQYWKPQDVFGNLLTRNNFIYHFLKVQQAGTVDTSLVSTDQIVNPNTMNAVFELPARLQRAVLNPPERQSAANLLLPSLEDGRQDTNPRHTPRVLLDGSDSIGVFGALARVYLNIGTFWEEWRDLHNPILGFTKQRPFELEVCQRNSVYWQTNERYRVPYLAAFFTLQREATTPKPKTQAPTPASYAAQNLTGAMKLRAAKEPDGATPSPAAAAAKAKYSPAQRIAGRQVWLDNCAICHSSKQPAGFELEFKSDWQTAAAPAADGAAHYTLPLDAIDWEKYRTTGAYRDYLTRLHALVNSEGKMAHLAWEQGGRKGPEPHVASLDSDDPWDIDHPFWANNYLSTDIRVPVSLVGTNASRALATNGIGGEMWDNFSSQTYKHLPVVGKVHIFNPFIEKELDSFDHTNDSFLPPGNGRGYYRPATHVSLWATAPFLHNNTLGIFNNDPTVEGRLVAYEDGIRRMLWMNQRADPQILPHGAKNPRGVIVAREGDLRPSGSSAAARDPGYIYRLPLDTRVQFAATFIRPIVEGVVGKTLTRFLTVWLWVILGAIFVFAAFTARPRHAGIVFLLLAIVAGLAVGYSGMSGEGGTTAGVLLMGLSNLLEFSAKAWWWIAVLLAVMGIAFVFVREDCHGLGRWLLALLSVSSAAIVWIATNSVTGTVATLVVGMLLVWLWRWKLKQFARLLFTVLAIAVVAVGWTANRFINGKVILHIPVANIDIGPLPIDVGPIPRGTPLNLLMSMDPESPHLPKALASTFVAIAEIKKQGLTGEEAWAVLSRTAGANLLKASKCPDFVLDKGHGFGEALTDAQKEALIAFLETL